MAVIKISGNTIGTTGDTDLLTLTDNTATVAGTVSATDLSATTLSGSSVTINHGGLKINGAAVSATAAELNLMDGVTSTTTELNILDGVTSTAAELNILDGVTSTAAEINLLDGSSAGTVVNSKAVVYSAAGIVQATDLKVPDDGGIHNATVSDFIKLGASTITIKDGAYDFDIASHDTSNGLKLGGTLVSATAAELNILDGVTSTTAELNYLDVATLGTAAASKAVVADVSANVDASALTWTDLGAVTTADINGGTLDGVTIGGASTAPATVSSLTVENDATGGNSVIRIQNSGGTNGGFKLLSGSSDNSSWAWAAQTEKDRVDLFVYDGGSLTFSPNSSLTATSGSTGWDKSLAKMYLSSSSTTDLIAHNGVTVTGDDETLITLASGKSIKAGSFVTYSDRDLKTNIETIENPVEKVMNLRGVTYDWKLDDKKDIGFIAQEVAEIAPEVCSFDKRGVARGIDYSRLTTILVEAVKDQQLQISDLKKVINKISLK
mgnify:CR=1 FL=1